MSTVTMISTYLFIVCATFVQPNKYEILSLIRKQTTSEHNQSQLSLKTQRQANLPNR